MQTTRSLLFVMMGLALTASACNDKKDDPSASKKTPPNAAAAVAKVDRSKLAFFQALPKSYAAADDTKAQQDLGRMLYYEARLSKNHDVSCNSCHLLDKFGVDNNATSPGHKGQLGGRNSPTVYNAAGHIAQFWDGRAKDVEEQALGPIENPVEMAFSKAGAMKVLNSMPEYKAAFKQAFPKDKEPLSWANVGHAIGAFERNLVTPSRFDKFLGGDDAALTADEIAGMNLYVATGCTACHMGEALGGKMYQKLGAVKPYKTADFGRFDHTKNEAEKYFFKVPSLRNIEKTGPYLHDGSIKTLNETVALMAEYQLGKTLSEKEVASIVTFLGALTGEIPTAYIAKPELPKSTSTTPKADPS